MPNKTRWGCPVKRFSTKVKWTKSGCLIWTGPINPVSRYASPFCGYGRTQAAHKWIYETLIGTVPKGLDLVHKCRVRHCVNVNHLEPVTRKENVTRGIGPVSRKRAYTIICKRGHAMLGNTYIRPNGERSCMECARIVKRNGRARLAKQKL